MGRAAIQDIYFQPQQESRSRYLRLLCWIRTFVLGFLVLALLFAQVRLRLDLPYGLLWVVLGGLIWLTVYSWWRSREAYPLRELEYGANILLELLGFSILLYLTGGATNPMVFYYLLPLSIAAATLGRHISWVLASVCMLAYSLLLFYYRPLHLFDMSHGMTPSWQSPHILGMWLQFILSAVLITEFVSRMADQIRKRERDIADRDQRQREDENLLAMGAFAAGTAHELATPLSTIGMVLEEVCISPEATPAVRAELGLARQEIARCSDIMQRLVSAAQAAHETGAHPASVAQFLGAASDQARNLYPQADIRMELSPAIGQRQLMIGPALQQGLLNLYINALDASGEAGSNRIDLTATLLDNLILLRIRDQGPGFPDSLLEKLGTSLVSSRKGGLGMGCFLANASINRAGGQLSIANCPDGGAEALIELPLLPGDVK